MATLGYVCGAAALLAAVGWLIGREIDRSTARMATTHLVSLPRGLHETLRATFDRLDVPGVSVRVTDISLDAEADCFVTLESGTLCCRPAAQTPHSYALVRTSMKQHDSEQAWDRVASLIQVHGGTMQGLPHHLLRSQFERLYDAAWRCFRSGTAQDLRTAHGALRLSLAACPATRSEERACVLANLACVCLMLQEAEAARLPRWLEGYDAAREALRLQYDTLGQNPITGLRPLIHDLQAKIAGATKSPHRDLCDAAPQAGCPQAIEAPRAHDNAFQAASAL